jgi:uncharacterized membrane protein
MSDQQHNKNRHYEHWSTLLIQLALIASLVFLLSIIAEHPPQRFESVVPHEEWLVLIAGYLILIAEIAATLIIGFAVIQAFFSYFRHLFDRLSSQIRQVERIRLRLGHLFNLGLGFAMASDILQIAISPSATHLTRLLAIVLLRVLLNYLLENETRILAEACTPEDDLPSSDD